MRRARGRLVGLRGRLQAVTPERLLDVPDVVEVRQRVAGPVAAGVERQAVPVEQPLEEPDGTGLVLEDCRYYAAVGADRFAAHGEVGRFRVPPMTVAEVAIRGGLDLELRARPWLHGSWLPRSGFVPDDQPGFEAWTGRPFAHGTVYFELAARLPARRA